MSIELCITVCTFAGLLISRSFCKRCWCFMQMNLLAVFNFTICKKNVRAKNTHFTVSALGWHLWLLKMIVFNSHCLLFTCLLCRNAEPSGRRGGERVVLSLPVDRQQLQWGPVQRHSGARYSYQHSQQCLLLRQSHLQQLTRDNAATCSTSCRTAATDDDDDFWHVTKFRVFYESWNFIHCVRLNFATLLL